MGTTPVGGDTVGRSALPEWIEQDSLEFDVGPAVDAASGCSNIEAPALFNFVSALPEPVQPEWVSATVATSSFLFEDLSSHEMNREGAPCFIEDTARGIEPNTPDDEVIDIHSQLPEWLSDESDLPFSTGSEWLEGILSFLPIVWAGLAGEEEPRDPARELFPEAYHALSLVEQNAGDSHADIDLLL